MKKNLIILFIIISSIYIGPLLANGYKNSFIFASNKIQSIYNENLLSLPPFKVGHYALRMYRQTGDDRYKTGIWVDAARVASNLNKFAYELYSPDLIQARSIGIEKRYERKSEPIKEALRKKTLQKNPEYISVAVGLLGSMARADEFGLKHIHDKKLRNLIRSYDFKKYATSPDMIKAWAAQLSNQVYWLKQLGEQDVVDDYISAFKEVYPESLDDQLTDQQFSNKIYGLTHIIIAASGYYQYSIDEKEYLWIYDYFRRNIDKIISRTKEDIIAETGVSFLLAGLNNDPALIKTQIHILNSIDEKTGIVPSTSGSSNIPGGEHRNVLSVMLLNWQGVNSQINIQQRPDLFQKLPHGLIEK